MKKGSTRTPDKLKFVLNIQKNIHEALDGMNIITSPNICVGEFLRVSSFYERLNLTNKIILGNAKIMQSLTTSKIFEEMEKKILKTLRMC